MATNERANHTNGILAKLGILAVGASLTLAACGTSQVLSETIATTAERQSVLGDPENPHWSRNTATFVTREARSILRDPGNPHWSGNTVGPTANDAIDQRGGRPY
jgi:hypothetical protein